MDILGALDRFKFQGPVKVSLVNGGNGGSSSTVSNSMSTSVSSGSTSTQSGSQATSTTTANVSQSSATTTATSIADAKNSDVILTGSFVSMGLVLLAALFA